MLESLTLAAALLTADAEVRRSDAFALAGELGRFPPAEIVAGQQALAKEHLEWLEARKLWDGDLNPQIDDLLDEQKFVIQAHDNLADARRYVACVLSQDGEWLDDETYSGPTLNWELAVRDRDRLRSIVGDDDYFAGRLPAPVTCQRR